MDSFLNKYVIDPDNVSQINGHLTYAYEQEFATTKQRQVTKLNKLIENKNEQTRGKANDRWVRNLSQRTLTETEKRVLSRGLNYAITPRHIPHEEYILATELACHKIQDQGKKAELRNTVAGILKKAKLPRSNVTKEEMKAVDALKKDQTITILPADKGRTTVVMDRESYQTQMENMLGDTSTYEILKKDPTENKKNTKSTIKTPTTIQ